jgi:hypothetical protein
MTKLEKRKMKICKSIIVWICFILFGNNIVAQNCKFEIDQKDAFTGKEFKETKTAHCENWAHRFSFVKEDTSYFIVYSFATRGRVLNMVSKGQEFLLKLENGEVIKFYALEEVTPTLQQTGTGTAPIITSYWRTKCPISKEQLVSISKSNPSAVKTLDFSFHKGASIDFSKKESGILSKYAECILN